MSFILLINIILSLIAVGLIWTIQLVHYPSMQFISKEKFIDFHNFHSIRISLIAMPLMGLELITSFLLLYNNNENSIQIFFLVNLIIVLLIWLSTFMIQVPFHNILSKGKNSNIISKLTLSNWLRTFLWTVRSMLMIMIFLFTSVLI